MSRPRAGASGNVIVLGQIKMRVFLTEPLVVLPPPRLFEQVLGDHAEQHQQAVVRLPATIRWIA